MTIRREDLVAAASLGLLQYRQVDPLLVYLLQIDVRAKREALRLQAENSGSDRITRWLSRVLAILAAVTGVMFALLFFTRAFATFSIDTMLASLAVYVAVVLFVVLRVRRGKGARIRLLTMLAMASVPMVVFVLQQASVTAL